MRAISHAVKRKVSSWLITIATGSGRIFSWSTELVGDIMAMSSMFQPGLRMGILTLIELNLTDEMV